MPQAPIAALGASQAYYGYRPGSLSKEELDYMAKLQEQIANLTKSIAENRTAATKGATDRLKVYTDALTNLAAAQAEGQKARSTPMGQAIGAMADWMQAGYPYYLKESDPTVIKAITAKLPGIAGTAQASFQNEAGKQAEARMRQALATGDRARAVQIAAETFALHTGTELAGTVTRELQGGDSTRAAGSYRDAQLAADGAVDAAWRDLGQKYGFTPDEAFQAAKIAKGKVRELTVGALALADAAEARAQQVVADKIQEQVLPLMPKLAYSVGGVDSPQLRESLTRVINDFFGGTTSPKGFYTEVHGVKADPYAQAQVTRMTAELAAMRRNATTDPFWAGVTRVVDSTPNFQTYRRAMGFRDNSKGMADAAVYLSQHPAEWGWWNNSVADGKDFTGDVLLARHAMRQEGRARGEGFKMKPMWRKPQTPEDQVDETKNEALADALFNSMGGDLPEKQTAEVTVDENWEPQAGVTPRGSPTGAVAAPTARPLPRPAPGAYAPPAPPQPSEQPTEQGQPAYGFQGPMSPAPPMPAVPDWMQQDTMSGMDAEEPWMLPAQQDAGQSMPTDMAPGVPWYQNAPAVPQRPDQSVPPEESIDYSQDLSGLYPRPSTVPAPAVQQQVLGYFRRPPVPGVLT